ncbi:MAG TPA: aldo/keto reductase [Myxococcota bacterium]|nr:aldo/keto reductase [Myxococcota bacterium]
MERRRFGALAGDVAVVGQGTWQMGSDRAGAVRALRRGLDLGMTHIDTAEMYRGSEEHIAEAIAGRRGEVFLVSKVLPQNSSRKGTIAACEQSLRRMRTDSLDVYLLHWRGGQPLAETVAGFEELERAGKIRAWGVSNFDVDDLEELRALAPAGRPACNQVLYHLEERAIEHTVLPWCERHQVALVGYSPFGSGRFPSARSAGGRELAEIAAAHGATPRQVALRFLVRRPALFAIPKAAREEHAAENAAAGDLELSAAELARIDAAFPLPSRRRGLPML